MLLLDRLTNERTCREFDCSSALEHLYKVGKFSLIHDRLRIDHSDCSGHRHMQSKPAAVSGRRRLVKQDHLLDGPARVYKLGYRLGTPRETPMRDEARTS